MEAEQYDALQRNIYLVMAIRGRLHTLQRMLNGHINAWPVGDPAEYQRELAEYQEEETTLQKKLKELKAVIPQEFTFPCVKQKRKRELVDDQQ